MHDACTYGRMRQVDNRHALHSVNLHSVNMSTCVGQPDYVSGWMPVRSCPVSGRDDVKCISCTRFATCQRLQQQQYSFNIYFPEQRHKPVPECHHSGFYQCRGDGRGGDNWSYKM